MKWVRRHRKKLLYVSATLVLLLSLGIWGGYRYFKSRFFTETPNTLSITGELHTVPFTWVPETFSDDYTEPHSAILIPVTVPGVDKQLYMQFDTGSPYTFLRSGCLQSLQERGVDCDLFEKEGKPHVRKFELNVSGNRVVLEPGRIMPRDIGIDWDKPYNLIGSLGADFIDNTVCSIDFPAAEIRLSRERAESFDSLGRFAPFDFKARRVILPATIDGVDMQLFWDSGCSSFGLFTSKYHCENYARPNEAGIVFRANRFGDAVPVHHKPCDLIATFGDAKVPLRRVSYVEMYAGLQTVFGRFIDGGFLGNKSLTNSTLVLDTIANEFLIVNGSLQDHEQQTESAE